MAIKPTIYKFKITLADIERDHYNDLNLTVALHPSETPERMMARVLAFCMNDRENLAFTKGLSAVEEPDIWEKTLDDRLSLWIDVGEPSFDRMKKSSRLCPNVKVYSFNFKSDDWWSKQGEKVSELAVSAFQFHWKGIQEMAELIKRTMECSITVSDGVIYVSAANGECEVPWVELRS